MTGPPVDDFDALWAEGPGKGTAVASPPPKRKTIVDAINETEPVATPSSPQRGIALALRHAVDYAADEVRGGWQDLIVTPAKQLVTHPIELAKNLDAAMARPLNTLAVGGHAAPVGFGGISKMPTPQETALAALATAGILAGGELGGVGEFVGAKTAPFIGETAGKVLGHAATGAAFMETQDPTHPIKNVVGGGIAGALMGGAGEAASAGMRRGGVALQPRPVDPNFVPTDQPTAQALEPPDIYSTRPPPPPPPGSFGLQRGALGSTKSETVPRGAPPIPPVDQFDMSKNMERIQAEQAAQAQAEAQQAEQEAQAIGERHHAEVLARQAAQAAIPLSPEQEQSRAASVQAMQEGNQGTLAEPVKPQPSISQEAMSTGSNFGYAPSMDGASLADRRTFTRDIERSMRLPEGGDAVAKLISESYGLPEPIQFGKSETEGLYHGDLNPVIHFTFPVGTDPAHVEAIAASRGLLFGQEAQAGTWRVADNDPEGMPGYLISTSDPIKLAEEYKKVLKPDELETFGGGEVAKNTILLRNFTSLPEPEFRAKLNEILDRLPNEKVYLADNNYGSFYQNGASDYIKKLSDRPRSLRGTALLLRSKAGPAFIQAESKFGDAAGAAAHERITRTADAIDAAAAALEKGKTHDEAVATYQQVAEGKVPEPSIETPPPAEPTIKSYGPSSNKNAITGRLLNAAGGWTVYLDPHEIAQLPGLKGEEKRIEGEKVQKLVESMSEKGFDPKNAIAIDVTPKGPKIYEWNHRVRAAAQLGIPVPAEVRYVEGTEATASPWQPKTINEPPPETDLVNAPPHEGILARALASAGEFAGSEAGSAPIPDVKAAVVKAATAVNAHTDAYKQLVSPAKRGEAAAMTARSIRDLNGEFARKTALAREALKQFGTELGRLSLDNRYEFMDAIETNRPQATPGLTRAAAIMRQMLDDARKNVQDLGTGKLEHFIEDYFPHIWKDPDGAVTMIQRIGSKRSLTGPGSFLKQRTIPTIREGVEAGLEPVTSNPVELTLLKIREMNRYIMGQKIFAEMKGNALAQHVAEGERPPAGWQRINDKVAQGYWAPEPAARIINNFLSPGLRGKNAIFDSYMKIGNVLNQAQLGLSAYHLGFVSLETSVSKASLGIEQLYGGHPLRAVKSFGQIPIAPITTYLRGSKILQEYMHPGTSGGELAQMVDGLVAGGGRVKMDDFYKNSSVEKFWEAFHTGKGGEAVVHSLPAILEYAAKPIMEHLVPRMKLGVFSDMAHEELGKLGPEATRDDVRAAMSKVWDSVDNRMGQMVYDNLFWNKALKDLSMASVRSVGWNLGTFRELGGGVIDAGKMTGELARGKKPELTHRTAYVIAYPFVLGLGGAMVTYLYTGRGPQKLYDYFYPPTGRTNDNGDPERLQLPSYGKDVIAYSRDVKNLFTGRGDPLQTVKHKVHPLLGVVSDMLANKNFFGDQIRNPDDPLVKQLEQSAKYLGTQFVPFGITNIAEEKKRGQPLSVQLPSLVGLTPAPRVAVRSEAENQMAEYRSKSVPGGATPEEQIARQARHDIKAARRTGDASATGLAKKMVREGKLTKKQARAALKLGGADWSSETFKRLTLEQAEKVFELGTSDEKAKWSKVLKHKQQTARESNK